jgi:hypothetical protein
MPKVDITNFTKQDLKTNQRIESIYRSSKVLRLFFDKGFRTFAALKSIVLHYYPETSENRLLGFWHFRIIDEDMAVTLEDVFEKLKSE